MSEHTKGQDPQKSKQHHTDRQEAQESTGRQNASANRGGTTDMDEEALTTDRRNVTERGSGLSSKTGVTGSDFDGQLTGQ